MENFPMFDHYFDSCASYPLQKNVLEIMQDVYSSYYANPSSPHGLGQKTFEALQKARSRLAQILNVHPTSLYFNSGATESINTLLQGYTSYLETVQSPRKEVVISSVEHLAVLNTALFLRKKGWTVHLLKVDANGMVTEEELKKTLNKNTAIVCLISVNNEVGTINPIDQLAQVVKQFDPGILFITDSAQALGKVTQGYDTRVVDGFFLSGHKIGAPKNSGFFYLNPEFRIHPILFGGGQESAYRPGTTDPALATFLAEAFSYATTHLKENLESIKLLNSTLTNELEALKVPFQRIVPLSQTSPYICSLSFSETRGNLLIAKLSEKGFYVSGGSACSSSCGTKSRILESMGRNDREAVGVVRFSFSHLNTIKEVRALAQAIADCTKEQKQKQAAFLSKPLAMKTS